jgi:hypothetical protein
MARFCRGEIHQDGKAHAANLGQDGNLLSAAESLLARARVLAPLLGRA